MIGNSKLHYLVTALMAAALLTACSQGKPEVQNHTFGFERIVSFDVAQTDGRIHLLVAGTRGEQTRIRYTYSTDGGQQWATPLAVDTGATPPHSLGHGNDLQIAAAGKNTLISVWPTAGEGWGGSGPLVSAVSHDGGQHWQPGPRPAQGYEGGQGYAAIKADAQGRFHLVWLDSRSGQQGIYHAHSDDGGDHWSTPILIDAATCECCSNELALSSGGDLRVLYRNIDPRDMALAAFSAKTAVWQARGAVGDFNWHFKGCPHAGGKLATGAHALHALVWTGKPSATGVYYLVSNDTGNDAGNAWSTPQRLADASSHHMALAARGAKHIAAAWETSMSGGDVIVTVSDDGGKHWLQREPLKNSSHPRLLATATGWLLVVQNEHGLRFITDL